MARQRTFTTGEVAKLIEVAPRTVSKWVDSGRMAGYRLPGSTDRRIPRESLVRFLKLNGLPLRHLDDCGWYKVLVVTTEPALSVQIAAGLPTPAVQVHTVSNGFDAGQVAAHEQPRAVVIDTGIGSESTFAVMRGMRSQSIEGSAPLVLAIAGEDGDLPALLESGFDGAWQRPVNVDLIVASIVDHMQAEESGRP